VRKNKSLCPGRLIAHTNANLPWGWPPHGGDALNLAMLPISYKATGPEIAHLRAETEFWGSKDS